MGLHNNVVAINNVVSSTGLLVQKKNLKNLFSVKNKVRAKNIIIDVTLIDIKDFITMKVSNSSMFCVFLFSYQSCWFVFLMNVHIVFKTAVICLANCTKTQVYWITSKHNTNKKLVGETSTLSEVIWGYSRHPFICFCLFLFSYLIPFDLGTARLCTPLETSETLLRPTIMLKWITVWSPLTGALVSKEVKHH